MFLLLFEEILILLFLFFNSILSLNLLKLKSKMLALLFGIFTLLILFSIFSSDKNSKLLLFDNKS